MTQTRVQMRSNGPVERDAIRRIEAYMRHEQTRRQLFGADGRIDRVAEWGGGEFGYDYDTRGDLIKVTEAGGRTRRYQYDDLRRVCAVDHGTGFVTHYHYDEQDRLAAIDNRGITTRYGYDPRGRVAKIQHGQSDVGVYRYDELGRVVLARTPHVTTTWTYDASGRASVIEQSLEGVSLTVRLAYDADGRLATMTLPGSNCALRYTWDERGRPQTVALAQTLPRPDRFRERLLARFCFDDATKTTTVALGNGLTIENAANAIDGRSVRQVTRRADHVLMARSLTYNDTAEIISDGERSYRYDPLGRLSIAAGDEGDHEIRFEYDALDNLVTRSATDKRTRFAYDDSRLATATDDAGEQIQFTHDRWGRLTHRVQAEVAWRYRYDDAGQLQEVRRDDQPIAHFLYDHKGRLVWANIEGRVERYLYSDADELLAVTDGQGQPLRLLVRTPLGVLAEVQGALGTGAVVYRHDDERGTTRLVTNEAGEIVAQFAYDPFGHPAHLIHPLQPRDRIANPQQPNHNHNAFPPCFAGRNWYAQIGLYYFGARWYDPGSARFLTPDSFTGLPDDARLINPVQPAGQQAAFRGEILNEWLKQPRVRNPYVFCGNDPIGRIDPTGHWSFGGVLLMLLGAIWTLPNTLFGILVEITCLAGEVIRWLVWLFSGGNVSWQTPGFDAAASGNLNAFALVFTGGWLGSFSNLLGITFGNVFFVYKDWRTSPYIAGLPDPIYPKEYNGSVSIPRERMLYEHELRHTNQYGWLGPFYHLGLPIFGFYEWDVIINGYRDAWTERDARAHAEP